MPVLKPDTSLAQDMGAIEPGTYPAKIVACDSQVSKNGNPMAVPSFEVMVDGKKRTRKSFLVVSGEGAYGFDQLLRACGFEDLADQYKDPNVQPKPDFDTDNLIGCEVNVRIDLELYQGQQRDNIKSYAKL